MIFSSTGVLKCEYHENYGYKAYVEIDKEIVSFYRKLIPKYIKSRPQKYPPHITVVRKEIPVNLDAWEKHNNHEIKFSYENIIRFGEVYLWINCFSKQLEEFRLELGLPIESIYTLPPEGFIKCFHCTIGNMKGL